MAEYGLTAGDMAGISTILKGEDLGNTADLEMSWAMKASDHADVYFNLITSVDPKLLRLTKFDDEIYTKFREMFPDMKIDVIDESEMKSADGKADWREFIEHFKDKVEDYNFGTLLRIDCKEGYTQENTTFSVRTQFLAIEIARNREGLNDRLRFTHGKFKGIDDTS